MEVDEAKEEEEEEEPEEEEEVVDLDTLDIFGIADIMEVGGKPIQQPLFSQFAFEDWALMSLRFELNLLVHAFKQDVKDPERRQIHEDNITFYYQKYFRKGLNPSFFGVKTVQELVGFFGDTIRITNKKILESYLPGELEMLNVFVLLAGQGRRDRNRRIDMGEEGAKVSMQTSSLAGMASQHGLNPGQANAIRAFAADAQARLGPSAATVRPAGGGFVPATRPGAMLTPTMVRPQSAWAPMPQQTWRPQVVPQGPWGAPRPASPWGGPQMGARPVSGLMRPVLRPWGKGM